jgi:hypothetical protein
MLAACGVLFAIPDYVHARASVPIVNVEEELIVRGDGKALTVDQVKRAIILAGSANKKEGWNIREEGEGALTATLVVRGKHTARVNIKYNPTRFSIVYRDSENLKFEKGKDGRDHIHPNYNKWVANLLRAITQEIQKVE